MIRKNTRTSVPTTASHLAAAAVVFVLCLGSAFAQEGLGRGRVTGQVLDESGAPVEGARVVAHSLQGTAKLEGETDRRGRFAIAGFGSGMWRFEITGEGFAPVMVDREIRQLRTNPPIEVVLEKLTGLAALQADTGSQDLFAKGNAFFDEERYDEASRMFEEFAVAHPDVYQVRINIASSHLKKGDLDKAEAEYLGVLETIMQTHGGYAGDKETSIRALSGLGEICLSRENYESGREYFSRALDLSPDDEAAAYNVGEILFSNQQVDEAVRYFKLAIQIRETWSKPYSKLGFVYLNKGDFDKALEYFHKFIEIDPENPEVPVVKNVVDTIAKMKK